MTTFVVNRCPRSPVLVLVCTVSQLARRAASVFSIFSLALLGCSISEEPVNAETRVAAPKSAFLGDPSVPAPLPADSSVLSVERASSPLASLFSNRDTLWLLSESDTVIDIVTSAITHDPSGSTVVLDRLRPGLIVLSDAGRVVGRVGGAGRGPGEFVSAMQIVAIGSDSALTIDGMNGLSLYTLDGGVPVFAKRIPADVMSIEDAAYCRGGLFVLAARSDGTLVHELSFDGVRLRSFGSWFGTDDLDATIRRVISSSGRMVCDERSGVIVTAASQYGQLKAYSATTGSELWSIRAPNFNDYHFELVDMNGRPGVRASHRGLAGDAQRALRLLPDGVLLSQSTRPIGRGRTMVNSRTITIADGRIIDTSSVLPLVVAMGAGTAVLSTDGIDLGLWAVRLPPR